MATLKAIQNHIIFQFSDGFKTRQGMKQFAEVTDWGFEVTDRDESMEYARWGIVVAVGKDVPDEIQPGMEIAIEKLKWTEAFQFEGEDYWRTDADQVLLINEGETRVSADYVTPDETGRTEYIRNVWK